MDKKPKSKHDESKQRTAAAHFVRNQRMAGKKLAQQFPGVEELDLNVEIDRVVKSHLKKAAYLQAVINCPSKDCTDGGFEIFEEVEGLVAKRVETVDRSIICPGQEMVGANYQSCYRLMRLVGTIKYKP